MECSRCQSEMVPHILPGLQLTWVCKWRGCSKGTMYKPRRYEQAPVDQKREQAQAKIKRILAIAASTIFPGEAASERTLATRLAARHCLSV